MISALLFGLIIGLILGMVGGGGAVLAVPALVYAVGLDVHAATTASLAVVGAGAATGAVGQARAAERSAGPRRRGSPSPRRPAASSGLWQTAR